MKIIKRDGSEVEFDRAKIANAIKKANKAGVPELSDEWIDTLALTVEKDCAKMNRAVSVEEVQDFVETRIMQLGAYEVAKRYIRYRHQRNLARRANTTDKSILTLIESNTRRSSRRIPTRTPQSTRCSATTWRARSARI